MPDAANPAQPSLYDALAPVYDRWQRAGGMTPFALVVLAKLLPVLDRLARNGRGAPGTQPSFVDLGCGTGELLLGLARAHPDWRLVGIDGSRAMLDAAGRKRGGDGITWLPRPLTALQLPASSFDAAGCFYDTLNHLTDLAALTAMVESVAGGLKPGGLFVFDATNELGFDLWWRGNRTWRGRDWSVGVETRYDRARRLGHAEVSIVQSGQLVTASLVERCFSPDELRLALEAAALDVVASEPWSPFEIDANGKTWWIARKRSG